MDQMVWSLFNNKSCLKIPTDFGGVQDKRNPTESLLADKAELGHDLLDGVL